MLNFFKRRGYKSTRASILRNYNILHQLTTTNYKYPEQFNFCLKYLTSHLLNIRDASHKTSNLKILEKVNTLKKYSDKIKFKKVKSPNIIYSAVTATLTKRFNKLGNSY